MRQAIDARGMGALVAESGDQAVGNLVSEIDHGKTIDNFDPLIALHFAIWNQAMTLIKERYQQNPLMLMADDSEHPAWACPICALNWCHEEHTRLCTQPECNYPKSYDWTDEMVNGGADHILREWQAMRP
jgi:hypothetical protein